MDNIIQEIRKRLIPVAPAGVDEAYEEFRGDLNDYYPTEEEAEFYRTRIPRKNYADLPTLMPISWL